MNLKFQETMKKYLNHILALFIALTALSSCSDDNEPSPVPEPGIPRRVATASCSTCRAATKNMTFF